MSEPTSTVRRGRLPRIGAAVVVLLAIAGYVVMQYVSGEPDPRCAVVSGDGTGAAYELSAEQAVNASTVAAVGTRRGMPERAVTIALATALQESNLHNIRHGDRDSLGLFQQRPSQGWGTQRQIMDPVYAAGRFYARLDKVPDYARLRLTDAAQRVQRSGFPLAYAKHEPDAALLAAALTGRAPATFTCEGRPGAGPGGPAEVRRALARDFGDGVSPKGGDASRNGKVLRVPLAPAPKAPEADTPRRGWELAHWAVAHASALHIERVSYAGREWKAGDSADEWRKAKAGPEKSGVRGKRDNSELAAANSGSGGGGSGEDGSGSADGPGGSPESAAEVRIVTGQ
ncbi:heavy metal transporter [Streptomyces aureoverticillatus]|uniref:heavy metal transporter n=1 Tax=Streptomyces aureoverticillatus TaxID=66871 RepID=UPI001EF78AE8|nr:heavy metal transporter [Streptomyces aureoverticillatus]